MTNQEIKAQGKRFVAYVDGQPLRNKAGATRTFKYQMEAERAAYIAAKEREAKVS